MTYELWDTESRNLVGTYESESEALDFVCRVAREKGWEAAEMLALGEEEKAGRPSLLASGGELAKRARLRRAGSS